MVTVERLIVCAGPPCVGKTTFIRNLRNESISHLHSQLRIGDASSWMTLDAYQLPGVAGAHIEKLILHYDFYKPVAPGSGGGYETDEHLSLLRTANEVTLLTLWAPHDVLIDRWQSKRARLLRDALSALVHGRASIGVSTLGKVRHRRIPPEPRRLYDAWFEFCAGVQAQAHWIVDTTRYPLGLVPCRPGSEAVFQWPTQRR